MKNEAEIINTFNEYFKNLSPFDLKRMVSRLENLLIDTPIKEKNLLVRIQKYISYNRLFCGDFESNVRKIDLFHKALMEHEDMFHSVINGYYSFDLLSYTRNLIFFLDLICDFIDGVRELADEEISNTSVYYEDKDSFIYGFELTITESVFQYVKQYFFIRIEENMLILNEKKYEGFSLNIQRVEEENAFEYEWFRNHLSSSTNFIIALKESDLMDKRFLDLLYIINKFSEKQKNALLSEIVHEIQGTDMLENNFADFLNSLTLSAFVKLMESIKETKLFTTQYSLIEEKFVMLMDGFKTLSSYNKYKSFSILLNSIKGSRLIKDQYNFINRHLTILLGKLRKGSRRQNDDRYIILLDGIKDTEFMMEKISVLVEVIGVLNYFPFSDSILLNRIDTFLTLFNLIKETEVLEKNLPLIGKKFSELLSTLLSVESSSERIINDQNMGFGNLTEAIVGTRLLQIKYPELLDWLSKRPNQFVVTTLIDAIKGTDKLKKDFPFFLKTLHNLYPLQYQIFSSLISPIVNTEVMEDYYSQIQDKFLELLNGIESMHENFKTKVFTNLIEPLRKTPMLEENLPSILNTIQKEKEEEYCQLFSVLLNTLETTIFKENLTNVLHSIKKIGDFGGYKAFSDLIDKLGKNEMLKECFSELLIGIKDPTWFNGLIRKIKGTKLMKTRYSLIETKLHKLLDYSLIEAKSHELLMHSRNFISVIRNIADTDLINNNFIYIFNMLDRILNKFTALDYLIGGIKGSIFSEENITMLLRKFHSPTPSDVPMIYFAFSKLVIKLNEEELLEKYTQEINSICIYLINNLNSIKEQRKVKVLKELISVLKHTNLIKNYFSNLFHMISKFSNQHRYYAFKTLILMNKETEWLKENISFINELFPEYSYQLKKILSV